jgi:hypothetical protein
MSIADGLTNDQDGIDASFNLDGKIICFYKSVKPLLPALCIRSDRINAIAHFPTNCGSYLHGNENYCLENIILHKKLYVKGFYEKFRCMCRLTFIFNISSTIYMVYLGGFHIVLIICDRLELMLFWIEPLGSNACERQKSTSQHGITSWQFQYIVFRGMVFTLHDKILNYLSRDSAL